MSENISDVINRELMGIKLLLGGIWAILDFI